MKIDKMKALIIICVTIIMVSAIGVFGVLKIDSNRAERPSEVLSDNESEEIENKSSKLKHEDSKKSNKENKKDSKKSNKENREDSNEASASEEFSNRTGEEGLATEKDVDTRLANVSSLIDNGKNEEAEKELEKLYDDYGFLTGHHENTAHELFVRLGLVDDDQYPEDIEEDYDETASEDSGDSSYDPYEWNPGIKEAFEDSIVNDRGYIDSKEEITYERNGTYDNNQGYYGVYDAEGNQVVSVNCKTGDYHG